MQSTKCLREFKRNIRDREEKKKTTSVALPESYLKFIEDNKLSLTAIVKNKIEDLMIKHKRELDKKAADDIL